MDTMTIARLAKRSPADRRENVNSASCTGVVAQMTLLFVLFFGGGGTRGDGDSEGLFRRRSIGFGGKVRLILPKGRAV